MSNATQTEEKRDSAPSMMEGFLLEVADAVNTTLDLETLMRRVAELVKRLIDYDVFAILLLNERRQELRIRFQVGHAPEEAERIRVKVGSGITGMAAQRGEAVLVNNVLQNAEYISSGAKILSELAVPLIVKGRTIGVIDVEASESNFFSEEHRSVLMLIASRVAIGVENARLYTRVARQAKQLVLLNEISRELTSILNQDQLFKRIGDLLLLIRGDPVEERQREGAVSDGFGDGQRKGARAGVVAPCRLQMDGGEIASGGDAAGGEGCTNSIAIDVLREADNVDEPADGAAGKAEGRQPKRRHSAQ